MKLRSVDYGRVKGKYVLLRVDFNVQIENGKILDQVEIERAYEIYDHYTNDLKQNSYIHKRWEELMEVKK